MKQSLILFSLVILSHIGVSAQILFTKTGTIVFNSKSTVEKIEATNKSVACKLNTSTGDVDFIVLIKSFVFSNKLMQDHFNETYMESDKFPKSNFKGKITNLKDINFAADGTYKATVEGMLSIHGVEKKINIPGTVIIKGGKVSISTTFNVLLADYKINIPGAVKDKISKDIRIVMESKLDALKK